MDLSERNRIISLVNEQEGYEPLLTGYSEGGEVESPDEMSEDNQMEPEGFADGGEVQAQTGGLFSTPEERNAARVAYGTPPEQPAVGPAPSAIQPIATQALVQPPLPSAIAPTQQPSTPATAFPTLSAADMLKNVPTFQAPSFTTPGAPAGGIPAVSTTPTFAKPVLRPEKELPAQVVNLAPMQVLEKFGGAPVSFDRPTNVAGYLTPEAAGATTPASSTVGGINISTGPAGSAGASAGVTTRTPLGYEYSTYRSLTPEQIAGSGNKTQILDMFKGIVTQQDKDVAALRGEYNQAVSYGNMGLADNLRGILQEQEKELAAAKADQLNAAKYFTGVGGAYETPQMLQERVLAEQMKALKLSGYTGADLGAIQYAAGAVDPFIAALNQQKNEYTAANNVYTRLAQVYGKDSEYAKNYLDQFVNPQKAEYDQMLAAQKAGAATLYGTIANAAKFAGYTTPKIAINAKTTEAGINNYFNTLIKNNYDKNIAALEKAKGLAEQVGLGQYSSYINSLIEKEREKIDAANRDRDNYIGQIPGRAMGSPQEGEISDPVARIVAQQSRTKDQGMDSTARAMLKKFAGGGEAKASAAPDEIPTGGVTADTKQFLSTMGPMPSRTEAMTALRRIAGEGASNLESLVRGSVAAIPGSFGDIEALFRDSDKTRKLATTEEVLRDYMPNRLTKPTKEGAGFEEVGTYMPLPVPAGTVSKAAKAAKTGAKKALEELGPTAAGMAEKQLQKAGLGPMNIAPEGPSTIRPLSMTERTEQGRLFSGRLDDFIASVRNPITKSQFLGSLKGKFRAYEIGRAAQALRDLEDTEKITPSELASRIEKVATPNRYRTTFIEPKEAGLHNKYDNVYGEAGHPVGSINLSYVPTHESVRAEEEGNKLRAAISNLAGAPFERIKDIREFVSTILANKPEKQATLLKGVDDLEAQLEQTRTKHGIFEEIQNLMYLRFPEQQNYYDLWKTKLSEIPSSISANRRTNPEAYDAAVNQARDEANMEVKLQALNRIQKEYGPLLDPELKGYLQTLPQSATTGGNELLTAKIDDLRKTLYTDLKTDTNAILADNVMLLDDIKREADKFSTYKGSHTAVNPERNALGFSRFTEHTVNVPGMGKLDGIYVSELQSDMFRDLKKLGKLGGSKQADVKEIQSLVSGIKSRFAPIENKLEKAYGGTDAFLFVLSGVKSDPKIVSQILQGPSIGMQATKADQLAADIVKDTKRIDRLKERAGILTNDPKGTYLIEEPISGMETQPQVVQQLLAKNAIAGAIQRGKSFVAFPGVESKQAKLYEKLPNNLRQVIKDLGEGFITHPIIIKGKDGVERQHLAVVWDNNAAQRLMNQGVPFKKGGLVDKKIVGGRKHIRG